MEQIIELTSGRMRHAMALLPNLSTEVRPCDMEPVHDDVPGAKVVDRGRKRGGHLCTVDKNRQCRFFWIIVALPHTHAKESWILLHQALRHLLLGRDGLAQHRWCERWKRAGLRWIVRRGSRSQSLRGCGDHFSANSAYHLRRSHVHALVDIKDDGCLAGMITAL